MLTSHIVNGLGAITVTASCFAVDKQGKPIPFCFGVGRESHELFQALQMAANKFADLIKFPKLDIDGFIGFETVNTLQAIQEDSGGAITREDVKDQESIALNAETLLNILNKTVTELQETSNFKPAPTGSPIKLSAADSVAVTAGQPPPEAINTAVAKSIDKRKRSLKPWIVAGVVTVLLLGVGYRHYNKGR